MKWTYSIKNKITASVVLLALCLLVLLSHYLDRMHTQNVKNAISTLYEDRLIAEDYILKMTSTTYEIREVLNSDLDRASKSNAIRKLTEKFNSIYTIYLKTKLTKPEKATAVELIWHLKKFGQTTLKNNHQPSDYTDKVLFSLDKLSTIQLEESKLIMKKVESQYATIKASSQFAFVIVIIILVVLQIMVFSGESIIPIVKSKDPTLN
jgi:multidrug efflux pump subunit AcrB